MPPLTQPQAQWLSRLTGMEVSEAPSPTPTGKPGKPKDPAAEIRERLKAALIVKLEQEEFEDEQLKAQLIQSAIGSITPLKETLREAFAIQVTLGKETRPFQALDGDLENAAYDEDLTADSTISKIGAPPKKKEKKVKGQAPEGVDPNANAQIVQKAGEAFKFLTTQRQDLQKHTTSRSLLPWGKMPDLTKVNLKQPPFEKGPEQPLFTDLELAQEIYTPLVQEHVLPEGFITNNFSKTQQMLNATNTLYKKELKDAKDPTTGLADFTSSMIDAGSDIASAVLQSVGADTNMAKALLTGCTELAKLSITTADKLSDKIEVNTIGNLLGGLAGIVGTMVGGVTGNTDLGRLIGAAGGAGAAGITMIVNSVDKGKPDSAGLVTFFGAVIKVGLESDKTNSSKDDSNKDIGGAVTDTVTKAVSAHSVAFVEAVRTGDKKVLRSVTIDICMDIAEDSPSWVGSIVEHDHASSDDGSQNNDPNALPTEDDKEQNKQDQIGKDTGEALAGIVESVKGAKEQKKLSAEELKALAEERFSELEKNVAKEEARKKDDERDFTEVGREITQQIEQEREKFNAALKNLNDPVVNQATIAKLIKQIERDRAIMKVAVAIGQGGFEVAANFFAPMAMGTEAIKMAANIAAAVQRGIDLRKFVDEATGAANATSPYLSSIQNFVDNQANQLTHYTLAAALNGAKIAASAAAAAFPLAAPAVPAVTAVQVAAEAGWTFFNKILVVKAWSVTKDSLAHPNNRRLGLKARRVNPTLAKYSIAYGATEEKDPVAVHMANACGLTNDVLANKDSNVGTVKLFLEKQFADDNKVVGKLDKSDDWAKKLPNAALEPAALFQAYHAISAGFKETNPAWATIVGQGKDALPPGDLAASIRQIDGNKLPGTPDAAAVEQRLMIMGGIAKMLRTERDRLGRVDGTVGDVIDEYVDLVSAEQEALAMQFVALKVAASKNPPPKTK
jgi:hypothetical protein